MIISLHAFVNFLLNFRFGFESGWSLLSFGGVGKAVSVCFWVRSLYSRWASALFKKNASPESKAGVNACRPFCLVNKFGFCHIISD